MKIFIDKTGEQREQSFCGTAKELLQSLSINPETVIVARNDELITLDDSLEDDDSIKILSVLSGG